MYDKGKKIHHLHERNCVQTARQKLVKLIILYH